MQAIIGKTFYYCEMPWHTEGKKIERPANMKEEEAIKEDGLDFRKTGIRIKG